ncbi:Uncharacterised protein [Actinobacillus pleuropneumoniae]|nr:Uncharacterised protein [Actinobacillus pleuropneumoniae]
MLKKIMRLALTPLLVLGLLLADLGWHLHRLNLKKNYPKFKFEKNWMKLMIVMSSEKS